MPKQRIVLETTNRRKAALLQTLDLQGDSLSDWLEEQLTLTVPTLDGPPSNDHYPSLSDSDRTSPKKVLHALRSQDWAFTHDDTSYLTHDLHPYPAKFIPQLPAHLIAALSTQGDVVFDPFGGSATTAVEAVRLGRRAVSLDANPLSGLIGRVKTGLLNSVHRAELQQLEAAVVSYVANAASRKQKWVSDTISRHRGLVPEIPNLEKWFADIAIAELATIRFLVNETTSGLAHDAALLALSRIVLRVSYQDSETRYVAGPKTITNGLAFRAYLESLRTVLRRLEHAAPELQRTDARFFVVDGRTGIASTLGENSVDLIVTSPPYPNATDYHLYHRFRLFWLGFDPRSLGEIEIGSHLRHQRNGTGFEEYTEDMAKVLQGCFTVLQPGKYAVFIVGDAQFRGKLFSTAKAIADVGRKSGFEVVGQIERPIHNTKRSFAAAGRRARTEHFVILRKPIQSVKLTLTAPSYKMWDYEVQLRRMETEEILGKKIKAEWRSDVVVETDSAKLSAVRRLTFSKEFRTDGTHALSQPTWQKVLENGDAETGRRKDPKYATHGIHPYKGKFYPQLAKSLMNISGVTSGGTIFDPFCGSGTTLLEGMLNGLVAYGCDMNPLAAKIATAKTAIFSVNRGITEHAIRSLLETLRQGKTRLKSTRDQFDPKVLSELDNWFPARVLDKLEWALSQIRLYGDQTIVDFCEVVLSSVIREVSQQDPTDLRIRRRKDPLTDAPVIELFAERLEAQLARLTKYWSVAGRQPGPLHRPVVLQADSREKTTFARIGISAGSIDCVITSPPYATALPYIDTDRLSLMAIMGIESSVRSGLEENLTGSREIRRKNREQFEDELMTAAAFNLLPKPVVLALRKLLAANRASEVGFRRENMAALLWRYFLDMRANLENVAEILRPGAPAYYVVGDSRTQAGDSWVPIKTCQHIAEIAEMVGFKPDTLLDIAVTTENFKHTKNAITKNEILEFRKVK